LKSRFFGALFFGQMQLFVEFFDRQTFVIQPFLHVLKKRDGAHEQGTIDQHLKKKRRFLDRHRDVKNQKRRKDAQNRRRNGAGQSPREYQDKMGNEKERSKKRVCEREVEFKDGKITEYEPAPDKKSQDRNKKRWQNAHLLGKAYKIACSVAL